MSSVGISFSGLASGLDTKAIVAALVAVERRPIAGMEDRKTALRKAQSLFGDLGGLLDKLKTAASKVRLTGGFLDYKVALDDDTHLGASIGSGAQAGTWEVQVSALAKAKVVASNGRADKDTTTFSGTFFLSVGNTTRDIVLDGDNLEQAAAKINAAGMDVQAQVLDTGATGPGRYKLVVNSTKTGQANAFTITPDDGDQNFAALMAELNNGANQVTPASDAQFTVNGVAMSRATNSFSDAIPGVTLDLKGVHTGSEKTRVTVTADATKTADKIKAFVDAYNAVVDFVETQNELDEDGKAKNPLFGDTTLRGMRSSLRTIVGGSVASGNAAFAMLVQVGISSDRDGKLTLDRAKLEEAIANDEDGVAALFSDATHGIAARVYEQIDTYTGSIDGLFKARKEGYDRLIKDLDRRIDTAETRLEAYEKQLVDRFAAMETLVGRLQSQGGALGALGSTRRN